MKHNEYGRSMVEMLGVLVVMGVLAITAVWGFRYAMDKQKANRLYNDAKVSYFLASSVSSSDWAKVGFTPLSGYELLSRTDAAGMRFVLAKNIDADICSLLLNFSQSSKDVILYTPMNEILSCQEEMQDIVFSFDVIPPLLPCKGAGECPQGYNNYCDAIKGVCSTCNLGQQTNASGTGCEDLCYNREDEYRETCVSEELGINWCCPSNTVCSDIAGKCIGAGNVCIYDMKETKAAEMYYTATCSYTMKETAATEMYYTATCGYDFSQSTDSNGNIATSFSKIGNSCPENHYCRLTWTEKTWTGSTAPTGFANDYTGEMWGVCVPLASTTANAQPVYPSSNNLLVRKNMKCPENHYCRLIWTKETWTGSTAPTGFANDYVGDMFGVCVPMSATTGNAQPVYPSSENLMSRKTDCPDGQYCNLRWTTTENNCAKASIPNDYVGLMYGGCIDLNKVNTATCPGSISGVMVP